jgi:hypothetical protein
MGRPGMRMIDIPRYTGRDAGNDAKMELDHFGNCLVCGGLIDIWRS